MYETILLATDGSDHAERAATHAVKLAACCGATLHALFVVETRTAYDNAIVEPEEARERLRAVGDEALDAAERVAAEKDVPVERTLDEGVPAECIADYVDAHGIDMVVLGERGHSGFKTVLLGSTAESVIYTVDVPVVAV
jgi:nucleotide-binding universal stress UspA family protein